MHADQDGGDEQETGDEREPGARQAADDELARHLGTQAHFKVQPAEQLVFDESRPVKSAGNSDGDR